MAEHPEKFKARKERALTIIQRLIAMANSETRRTTNQAIEARLLDFFAVAERSVALGLKGESAAASKVSKAEVRPARM